MISILPLLGVIGGSSEVAKAINDNKVAQRQLKEMKRHIRVMEGHGVYLRISMDEKSQWKK